MVRSRRARLRRRLRDNRAALEALGQENPDYWQARGLPSFLLRRVLRERRNYMIRRTRRTRGLHWRQRQQFYD